MAKEEKKNVGALDDKDMDKVSGGKNYWNKKPAFNPHINPMTYTGRFPKISSKDYSGKE